MCHHWDKYMALIVYNQLFFSTWQGSMQLLFLFFFRTSNDNEINLCYKTLIHYKSGAALASYGESKVRMEDRKG